MTPPIDLTGREVIISAKILEHLRYAKKSWFTVELPNGQKVTIGTQHCRVIKDEAKKEN